MEKLILQQGDALSALSKAINQPEQDIQDRIIGRLEYRGYFKDDITRYHGKSFTRACAMNNEPHFAVIPSVFYSDEQVYELLNILPEIRFFVKRDLKKIDLTRITHEMSDLRVSLDWNHNMGRQVGICSKYVEQHPAGPFLIDFKIEVMETGHEVASSGHFPTEFVQESFDVIIEDIEVYGDQDDIPYFVTEEQASEIYAAIKESII